MVRFAWISIIPRQNRPVNVVQYEFHQSNRCIVLENENNMTGSATFFDSPYDQVDETIYLLVF